MEIRNWLFFSSYSPFSWDRQGARLAVSLPAYPGGSPRPLGFAMKKNHVYVLDVNSGEILPAQFCTDPVRNQRFEREAKTISRVNHPHICVLRDVGHQDWIKELTDNASV